ncbi:MAG: AAA family ATPase [Candidatus Thermoplasmatota archaeon]|nr:AAA family ATPase [Candidatus Thermoplasmatota archaeon]MBU4071387.1 AAA family ATPase [Candidatus Thermoplasmatota archaeon]MBU4143491.1 AAA family ATPase [Candidatus Thermoplasmatota archaeon]MBU4591725.1 AAA family ATPase [Candidatus Thermoplasmatota archaeon]
MALEENYQAVIFEIEQFIKRSKSAADGMLAFIDDANKADNGNIILTLQNDVADIGADDSVNIKTLDTNKTYSAQIVQKIGGQLEAHIEEGVTEPITGKVLVFTEDNTYILKQLEWLVNQIKADNIDQSMKNRLKILFERKEQCYDLEASADIIGSLNREQSDAVQKSIHAEHFYLIIGPPGTGKTYVIEELIRQYHKKKKKILITAFTNLAVDNIIDRISKEDKYKIVRVGSPNSISPAVQKYTINSLMQNHELYNQMKTLKERFQALCEYVDELEKIHSKMEEDVEKFRENMLILISKKEECEKDKAILEGELGLNHMESDAPSPENEYRMMDIDSKNRLELCRNILKCEKIESQIPEETELQSDIIANAKLKRRIAFRRFFSFTKKQKNALSEMRQNHSKMENHIQMVNELKAERASLKGEIEALSIKIYKDKPGDPFVDSLNAEIDAFQYIYKKYKTSLSEYEITSSENTVRKVLQGVYKSKISLLDGRINMHVSEVGRIGAESEILKCKQATIKQQIYSSKMDGGSIYKNIQNYKDRIAKALVNEADVIGTTVISSCNKDLRSTNFDVMVMDEASQVASYFALLPISKSNKFILVGDNKQLQPIEDDLISKKLNESIFNSMLEKYPNDSTMLTTQHRMNENIAQISNKLFYGGKMLTAENISRATLNLSGRTSDPIVNPENAVILIDTGGSGYYEDEVGRSCSNQKEAEAVADIVQRFSECGIEGKSMGVISPYAKHCEKIRHILASNSSDEIEVNTVHKFQGKEKELIILSFAKSKFQLKENALRFLENQTLINVAITRAKKKLVIIGDFGTLKRSQLLNAMYNEIGHGNILSYKVLSEPRRGLEEEAPDPSNFDERMGLIDKEQE